MCFSSGLSCYLLLVRNKLEFPFFPKSFSDQVSKILEETTEVTDRELIETKFQLTDTNHDGRISFDEFMIMIKQL